MAIKYPLIIILSIILFVLIFIIKPKKDKYKNAKKIANTSIVKNTEYYKKIEGNYKKYKYVIYILLFISTLSCAFLSSRITSNKEVEDKIYNRDIILCMDVSTSVDELNSELAKKYK